MQYEAKCGNKSIGYLFRNANPAFGEGFCISASNHLLLNGMVYLTDVSHNYRSRGLYAVLRPDNENPTLTWWSGQPLYISPTYEKTENLRTVIKHTGSSGRYDDTCLMCIGITKGTIAFLNNGEDDYFGDSLKDAFANTFNIFSRITKQTYLNRRTAFVKSYPSLQWYHKYDDLPLVMRAVYYMARRLRGYNELRRRRVVIDLPNDRITWTDKNYQPREITFSKAEAYWLKRLESEVAKQDFIDNLTGS